MSPASATPPPRRSLLPALAITALLTGFAPTTHADPIVWIGGNGSYTDGANWEGGVAPTGYQSILIANGGVAQISSYTPVSNVTLGDGNSGALLVSGGITSGLDANEFYAGYRGLGTLSVGPQIIAGTGDLYAGYHAGATGIVILNGAYLSPFATYFGFNGNATATLQNGSTLQSTVGHVGYGTGSHGVVNLDSSVWKAENQGLPVDITIGESGWGEVNATNSTLRAQNLALGNGTASLGRTSLSGGNLTVELDLTVGNSGSGNLSLSDGAAATNRAAVLAAASGSVATTSLGGNSSWTNQGDVTVGLGGSATLTATGSSFEAQELFIARNAGSTGNVTFSGGTATVHGEIHVAPTGSGQLTLENGAIVTSDKGNVGFNAGGSGTVTINDALWEATRAIFVGVHGPGSVAVSNEGGITSESAYIGQNATGTGIVSLTSNGSWSVSNTLAVGVFGTGNLTVSSGGEALSAWAQIGLQAGSTGAVTLDRGTLFAQNTLTIGQLGSGRLTAGNASTITAGTIQLAASSNATGALEVANSTIETEVIIASGGNASLSLANARIQLRGGSSVLDSDLVTGFAPGAITVSGNLEVDTQGGNAQITSGLSGNGSLTKTGDGRLRLTTANSFSGGTAITRGVLELAGNAALGTGNVTVGSAELRAFTNAQVSSPPLISVGTDRTGVFSAITGQALTLASPEFRLGGNATLQIGSAGNAGTVVLAASGNVSAAADSRLVVSQGTLRAGNGSLLALAGRTASVTVASGATLDFNNQVSGGAVGRLLGAGTVNLGSSSNNTLAVNSGNFSGTIAGSGTLNKQSPGTLVLGGNVTTLGDTIITGGKLQMDGFGGYGITTVEAGGTLSGSGTLGEVSLAGGAISPGAGVGNLTITNLYWTSGQVVFDLGADSDYLNLGGLEGFGTSFQFRFVDAGWSPGTTYNLLTATNSSIPASQFGYTNTGGFAGTFAYSGNQLQFTVTSVPEPGAWALTGGLAVLACLLRAHSRRKGRRSPSAGQG